MKLLSTELPQVFNDVGSIVANMKPQNPVICFNPNEVYKRVDAFKDKFPGITSWAIKSNPHPEVVKAIVKAGITHFDVASKGEIEQINCVFPDGILHFNHPVKSPEEIEFAYLRAGVLNFVVDCIEEVEKIEKVVSKKDCGDLTLLVRFQDPYLRITGNYDFAAKFGAIPDDAAEILRSCVQKGFRPGLAFHSGSQNRYPDVYISMIGKACEIAQKALGNTTELIRLNIGGGFPCSYPGGHEPKLDRYFKAVEDSIIHQNYEIICEPGRALVADSISLLTRVNLRRGTERRIYINDGFYGSFMELPFVDFMPPARAYNCDGTPMQCSLDSMEEFSIWGSTCDSIDKLPKPVKLPPQLRTGDYIEFGLMGAYTNATYTSFNGIKTPDLVFVMDLKDWSTDSYSR